MASAKTVREVSVFGTDASGKPFFEKARVVDVDGFEVTLEGVARTLDVSNVVGLRHAGQKARYRVAWVGRKDSPQQGQVGLWALEREKDIFAGSEVQKPTLAERERRRYPRIRCQGDVQFRREGTDFTVSAALRMLSEGGCYIETPATLPELAHLDLNMNVEGLELRTMGEVHAPEPGSGMGIEFIEMNSAQRLRLHEWVSRHSRLRP